MKVVAFNGSPKEKGNTYAAIRMVAEELQAAGILVEVVQVGDKMVRGCIACGGCAKNQDEKCVLPGDEVNAWLQKMKEADGIILGSPVHYSGISATMKAFLDRAFYVASANGGMLRHKAAAAVVAVRRSGGVATFDQLNHYIHYAEMLLPTANYWSVIHGRQPAEAEQDEEGKQIMRVLGKNMAWLLKLLAFGKDAVAAPEREEKVFTNFIR